MQKAFVTLCDVVGFKSLRKSIGTMRLHELYKDGILPVAKWAAAGNLKPVIVNGGIYKEPDFSARKADIKVFSDTVVLYSRDDSYESFKNLLVASYRLLELGFSGGKFPFRGAVGYGDFISDGDILLGESLEDAHKFESEQVWSGCVLTANCRSFADECGYLSKFRSDADLKNLASMLIEYPVPVQTKDDGRVVYSERKLLALNWTLELPPGFLEAAFVPSEDNGHVKRIVENTKHFESAMRALVSKQLPESLT